MATVAYEYPQTSLQQRHRSQSDSNLLNPTDPSEINGTAGHSMIRMGSVGELSPHKSDKKKGFFHRLVRPWKWRKKRRGKDQSG